MAIKKDNPYLARIPDNEEIFVLRASDVTAPLVIEYWARLQKTMNDEPDAQKILDAQQIASKMRNYKGAKLPD